MREKKPESRQEAGSLPLRCHDLHHGKRAYGPGKLGTSETVVASKNPVSLDAFCCRFLGLKPEEVLMIPKASRHGLGNMNLGRLNVRTLSV